MSASSASTWRDHVRRGLASGDARERLHTYSTLSTKCSESKQSQKQMGQLFGGPCDGAAVPRLPGSSLLNVLLDDLRSTDRTLRIAAARVVCLMAYENLTNQQLIKRSQADADEEQVGVTVGWVHAFSIPQSLRGRYEAHCEERGMFTTPRGLVEFVSSLIKDNYAAVYRQIGRYYAGGCRDVLPLCWCHALAGDSSEATDMLDVPDPNENLVGFYLVPRQMQFPEQDASFLQEILASIRAETELSRLQQVHAAFQQVAFRAKDASTAALKAALERGAATCLRDEEDAFAVSQRHRNVLKWLDASCERMITWNDLLVWCCTDMNAEEMLNRFGADACSAVEAAFRRLTLGGDGVQQPKDQATTYAWEPALVGAVLDHPSLPEEVKTSVRNLSSTYASRLELSRPKKPHRALCGADDEALDRPWGYLLPLELTEIHPISWGVFLSKWRQSADAKPDEEDVPIYHQSERRHHSVGEGANPSVLTARKNALATMHQSHRIFHSFRDLNQLRQQLPLIASRPAAVAEEAHEGSIASRSRSLQCHQLSEAEQRQLEEKRTLFRRLQQSSLSLDEATRQRLEEKRGARSKAHAQAAENRKKAEQLAAQRRQERERARRDRQGRAQERLQRKENHWQMLLEARQERQQRAQWWKQIQVEAEVARQEEFYLRQSEQLEAARRIEQQQSEPALSTVSLPQPPSTPPGAHISCPRRPSSARRATDPRIARERAHVYGCAATEAFAARRPHTARLDLSCGTRSPRSKHQPGSRRRGRPGGSRSDSLSASSRTDPSSADPQTTGIANACATLVMTNAAHAVAEHIAIPPVAGPAPEEETVPPAVIMAQYWALEKEQRFKLHERYGVNRVSHKLTFTVLQQLTHEMRQDAAWRAFLQAAGGPPGTASSKQNKSKREAKVTHAAFATVASQLGISMAPKKLQAVARSLDAWKTGFVSWEAFYTWWSAQ